MYMLWCGPTAGAIQSPSAFVHVPLCPIPQRVGQYVVYRNENENPGNAKHQLGLFSEESAMSAL